MVSSRSNVYVAWLNDTLGNSNILFRSSSNNGSSFGPVIDINNPTTGDSVNQEIYASGSNVYVVWEQNFSLSSENIFFRASLNNGTSFGPVINVSGGITGLSTSTLPDVSAIGNNVWVVWLAVTTKGADEILIKTSTTNGSDLATALPITLSTKAYASTKPQIAAVNSNIYVTWSDDSLGRGQTFFSSSSNGGSSFGTAFTLSNTLAGETDLYQQIAAVGSNVFVTWTNDTISTDNTMFAASTSNGVSFTPVVNLNKGVLTDLNPQLAVSGNNVYVVWSDTAGNGNTEVLYRASNNNGASFNSILNMSRVAGLSNQQTISAMGNNVYIAWVQSGTANDGVHFISSNDGGSTFGSSIGLSVDTLSSNPIVAGAGSYAYVTWEDGSTGSGDIYFVSASLFDFAFTNSTPITVTPTGLISANSTISRLNGFRGTIILNVSGTVMLPGYPSPAALSCQPIIPNTVNGSNVVSISCTGATAGNFTLTLTGTSGAIRHSIMMSASYGPVGGVVRTLDTLRLLMLFAAPFSMGLVILCGLVSIMIRASDKRRSGLKADTLNHESTTLISQKADLGMGRTLSS